MNNYFESSTPPAQMDTRPLSCGLDVGSMTVKAVVMDADNRILAKAYHRHNARQPELVREYLREIGDLFPGRTINGYITGSGSRAIAPVIDALYVQEVNAVTYAVENLYPDTGSVVELGGQDAKIIIWQVDENGRKTTLTSMNDKCAGGTGATIDRILDKTGMSGIRASAVRLEGAGPVHHIAAKCGVFAETDVVGLLKSGVDQAEIIVALCTAIVRQNLEVLVRGNILRDRVMLLGGPHHYLPVLTDVWRRLIPLIWQKHGWTPAERPVEELIYTPPDAQFFAAIGAVMFGKESEKLFELFHPGQKHENVLSGTAGIDGYISHGRLEKLAESGAVLDGLVSSQEEMDDFAARYSIAPFVSPEFPKGAVIRCYLGVDGGSTSTKIAVVDEDGRLIYRDYVLSGGNPVVDARDMFNRMNGWCDEKAVTLDIAMTAVTGYASSILKKAFRFDTAVVETVAHMRSAVDRFGDVDIICDVGGQDIKVLFMKHGRVVDFRLNTQCSAGNGYFIQSVAQQFGVPIEEYAQRAFRARKAPAFNYGCAVFMEQDRVNFQQMGWTNDEIMAGLALVLPLNIWNYVVQDVNIGKFGRRIVLQGGTQKNLAVVKSQVDFITGCVADASVNVHPYAEICGAYGAALEAKRSAENGAPTSFVGTRRAASVKFTTRNDESTRCGFCSNRCSRVFVDIDVEGEAPARFISGYGCERGAADTVSRMREIEKEKNELRRTCPNLSQTASVEVFGEFAAERNPAVSDRDGNCRSSMIIGMPRLLNMYFYAPFFSTYFRSLGIGKIVWSDYTSAALWEEGNTWGAIDPCFPAKVAPAHIHNLLMKKEVTHICFPCITHLESIVEDTSGNNACPIQMGTPEVVHAAFTKYRDEFAEHGVSYWKPLVNLERRNEAEEMLFEYFSERLGVRRRENRVAVSHAYAAMEKYCRDMQRRGAEVLNRLVEQDGIGILVIGHPYHHDPGLNHGIPEEFRMRGFPVMCMESIPLEPQFLSALLGENPFGINDVWERNFNRNANLKIWVAKFASRHPNIAVVDLSSFKCGFDAPMYSYIDAILDASATPHFLFHDIDQNRPRATYAIRVQTIEYFLDIERRRLRERLRSEKSA